MSTRLDENYVLGDVLGRGGMGIVYSATQRSLERRVAVKIPHPELAADPVVHQRFRTEALAGAKLTHRNIARVIDFGAGEPPYIVMEHVAGIPLDKLVSDAGAMETRIASDVSRQILAALHEAHCAGIIHADIKTGNVLVETLPDGELHARVIDFGLAHFTNQESSFDGRVLSGTPDYLAPELVQGEAPFRHLLGRRRALRAVDRHHAVQRRLERRDHEPAGRRPRRPAVLAMPGPPDSRRRRGCGDARPRKRPEGAIRDGQRVFRCVARRHRRA
jgi:serine/threonine protein kinase